MYDYSVTQIFLALVTGFCESNIPIYVYRNDGDFHAYTQAV